MKRIPRLRRPCSLFASPAPPSSSSSSLRFPQSQVSVPTTTARCISSSSSTSARPGQFNQSPRDVPNLAPEPTRASFSGTESQPPPQPADESYEAAEGQQTEHSHQSQEPVHSVPLPPKERTWAPRLTEAEVSDPSYEPAQTAEGLPEIKSTADWFADDANWDAASRFVGFAPAMDKRVQDLGVLEVLLRRAVVEALAVRQFGGKKNIAVTWNIGGREELVKALGLRVKLGEGTTVVAVTGDVKGVLKGLLKAGEEEEGEEEDEVDDEDPKEDEVDDENPKEKWDDEVVEETPADIETKGNTTTKSAVQETFPFVKPEEAAEMCKGQNMNWRNVSLEDMSLKFAIVKRIYQLTGHRIHDYKLHSILTVGDLLKVLQTKPKPTKLFDFLAQEKPDTFAGLPNVKVYPSRVTPIDKEKMVGRWKIIERELERRGLPATGHEHLPRPNQRSWIVGKT